MKRILKNQETQIIEVKDVDFSKGIVVYNLQDVFIGYLINQDNTCYIIDTQGTRVNSGHPFELMLVFPSYKYFQL